jgi:HSP20 family molecular chaperone IbpA
MFVAKLPEVDAPRDGETRQENSDIASSSTTTPEQPQYVVRRQKSGAVRIVVSLPLLEDMRGLELDVSERGLSLQSSPDALHQYHLTLQLDERVDAKTTKAKFNKAARELRVTLPVV